jgi:hypothetical protein
MLAHNTNKNWARRVLYLPSLDCTGDNSVTISQKILPAVSCPIICCSNGNGDDDDDDDDDDVFVVMTATTTTVVK